MNYNPNKRERYIMMYADEYDYDVWEEYCKIFKVSPEEYCIRINFDYSDVVPESILKEEC